MVNEFKSYINKMNNIYNSKVDVSVLMITYGHETFIEEAINGVLMQQCDFDIELIIANDCSPDKTNDIINQIIEIHPKAYLINYCEHKKNLGANDNFIWASKQAKGKYIAICEGDDYWIDPFKLQKQLDFLEGNPDYGLVFTDADLYYQNSKKLIKNYDKTFKRNIPTGNVLSILIEGNPYKTCTSLFRYKLIEDIFDKNKLNKKSFGDKSLWMHIASKSKVAYISESTSVYRVLETSASHFNNLHEVEHFFEEVYIDSIDNAKYYNIPIDNKKLRRNYNKAIISYCLEKNMYEELLSNYKYFDLIIYLFAKEKIVRPLYKLINN